MTIMDVVVAILAHLFNTLVTTVVLTLRIATLIKAQITITVNTNNQIAVQEIQGPLSFLKVMKTHSSRQSQQLAP